MRKNMQIVSPNERTQEVGYHCTNIKDRGIVVHTKESEDFVYRK